MAQVEVNNPFAGALYVSRKKRCAKRRTTKRSRVTRRNRAHPTSRLSYRQALTRIRRTRLKNLSEKDRKVFRSKSGKQQISLFANFWRIPKVPSIRWIPGPKTTTPAVGMGFTPIMYISDHKRGQGGKRQTEIRGNWHVITRASGSRAKGRTIYFMTGKKLNGPMRQVGWAPKCMYIPYKDVEAAGSPKAGSNWKHAFSDDHGVWPEVYADTPTLSKKTNFVVTNGTFTVSDWIRR